MEQDGSAGLSEAAKANLRELAGPAAKNWSGALSALGTAPASRGVRAADEGFRGHRMTEQLPVQLSFDVSLPERAQRIRDRAEREGPIICLLEPSSPAHRAR